MIEAVPRFLIVNDFILSQNIGEWKTVFYSTLDRSKDGLISSRGKLPYIRRQIVQSISQDNLNNGMSRTYAWALLLGISNDLIQQSYRDLYAGLKRAVFSVDQSSVLDYSIQRQIALDVARTFGKEQIESFTLPVGSQENSLYNVLACYAKLAPDVGYCQGMNFFAGMILIGVDFDEVVAFTFLVQLMGD